MPPATAGQDACRYRSVVVPNYALERRPRDNTLETSQVGAGAFGQTGRGCALEHQILNAIFFTVFALAALVAVLVHHINVRLQTLDFRIGIQPAVATGNQRLLDVFD